MKANEAPERIWINSPQDLPCGTVDSNSVEYTRTDAFIEKACNGIEKLLSGYIIRNFNFGDSYDVDKLIEGFKNYMEGE